MKLKRLETRKHFVMGQLQSLLFNLFSKESTAGFKMDYYVGEEIKTNIKGLYTKIYSKNVGVIYEKFAELLPHQVVEDIEEKFVDEMMNDMILGGVTFMNFKRIQDDRWIKKAGKKYMLDRTLWLN